LIRLLDASPKQGVGVEFGVYKGGTLDTLATFQPWRAFYGFDTFSGLPLDHWKEGEPHRVGDFRDTGYLAVAELMPSNVTLLPGLFPAVAAGLDIPVGFAHVDFDFELSTAAAIGWLRERVIPGAIVVFDDFDWMHCPGVRKAIEAAGIEVKQSTEHQVFWVAK
jgi:hypothetical protein